MQLTRSGFIYYDLDDEKLMLECMIGEQQLQQLLVPSGSQSSTRRFRPLSKRHMEQISREFLHLRVPPAIARRLARKGGVKQLKKKKNKSLYLHFSAVAFAAAHRHNHNNHSAHGSKRTQLLWLNQKRATTASNKCSTNQLQHPQYPWPLILGDAAMGGDQFGETLRSSWRRVRRRYRGNSKNHDSEDDPEQGEEEEEEENNDDLEDDPHFQISVATAAATATATSSNKSRSPKATTTTTTTTATATATAAVIVQSKVRHRRRWRKNNNSQDQLQSETGTIPQLSIEELKKTVSLTRKMPTPLMLLRSHCLTMK